MYSIAREPEASGEENVRSRRGSRLRLNVDSSIASGWTTLSLRTTAVSLARIAGDFARPKSAKMAMKSSVPFEILRMPPSGIVSVTPSDFVAPPMSNGLSPPVNCPAMPPRMAPSDVAIVAGGSVRSSELVTAALFTTMLPRTGRSPPFGFVFGSFAVLRFTGIVRSAVNVSARMNRSSLKM